MSNAEHLIENAIVCLINEQNYNVFKKSKVNIEMAKVSFPDCDEENILEQIWEMANEVCFSWFYDETFKEQFKKGE